MTSQDCIHDIPSTLFMTSHPLFLTSHTLYLWDPSHGNSDKTPAMFLTLSFVYITSHMVYEWRHHHCILHHTHSISVITLTWWMIPHTMYIWIHTQYTYDTMDTLYYIKSSLDDTIPLFVCQGTHYFYDLISTIYDLTHTVCMTTQALYCTHRIFAITSSPLISHPIVAWHHTRHMYGNIFTIQDIASSDDDIKPQLLGYQSYYICHRIHCICVITSTLLMISHQLSLWVLMRYIRRHHIHCLWHHIHYIFNITSTVSVSSHPHLRWYHTLCMYDITPPVFITPYTLYKASHPHFMTSHIFYHITCTVLMTSLPCIWHCIHSIDDLWPTACMIPHLLYVWHFMHYTYRHIHALWTHPILVITLYPLRSWHHTHSIWHHTHDKPNLISAISPYIWNYVHSICVIKPSVSIIPHTISAWQHTHSM